MILCFTLSMPGVASWNGKWSGDGKLYAKIHNFGKTKKATEKAKNILSKKSYGYSFGDGWFADVSVHEVDAKEAGKIRRKSRGFCGYDWMVTSIRLNGEITT